MLITSRQNPKVKSLVSLRKPKERLRTGLTLVEGYEELTTAYKSGAQIKELYYCPELMNDPEQLNLIKQIGSEHFEMSRTAFEKAAYREGPDGWLAVCRSVNTNLEDVKLTSENPILLVCEAIEKPGNLGAMLRTANAAGIDAVITTSSITDWSNPNIVRASKGALFSTKVAEAEPNKLFEWLRNQKISIVASTPAADRLFTDVNMSTGIALFVGSEKYGLSDFWINNADLKVKIPMFGQVDSLNAATSGALLMYEAIRQRLNNF